MYKSPLLYVTATIIALFLAFCVLCPTALATEQVREVHNVTVTLVESSNPNIANNPSQFTVEKPVLGATAPSFFLPRTEVGTSVLSFALAGVCSLLGIVLSARSFRSLKQAHGRRERIVPIVSHISSVVAVVAACVIVALPINRNFESFTITNYTTFPLALVTVGQCVNWFLAFAHTKTDNAD